jgi:SnoaL-like domain
MFERYPETVSSAQLCKSGTAFIYFRQLNTVNLNFYNMKILILVIPAMLLACTQKSITVLNGEQTKKIQEEIQPVIAQIYDAAAHVDTTKLYDVFSFADNDFTYVETTGTFYDQAAYKQMVRQFYGPLTSEIIEKGTEKFTFLGENNVLWSYSGGLTATYKDGKQEVYDPFGMTMLFRKTGNKWKVVFLQESTQEPSTKH